MTDSKLFQPIQIGDIKLRHRVVLAPLTRFRADEASIPLDIMTTYYEQRASTKGTLLITEGTGVTSAGGAVPNMPCVETQQQLNAWKKVTDAVHKNESFIFCQIAGLGRMVGLMGNAREVTGPSDIPAIEGGVKPRPLSLEEIKDYIGYFRTAASNLVNQANFDGLELHACHGSLLDQFLQDVSNVRTDKYGGSVENRARFVLEVVEACVQAIGPTRVAVRLSPWNNANGMGMEDPVPTYTYLVNQLSELFPDLAYLHVVEPRISPNGEDKVAKPGQSNDFLRTIWYPRPYISAGGYTKELATEVINLHSNELVAFGRQFIANPDLPKRLFAGVKLNPYDRPTFYTPGEAKGYIDYPFYNGNEAKYVVL